MKRCLLPGLACALAVGCGPMNMPLPHRFDPESQREIDDSWDRAFTPPGKLAHQDLLDVMVGMQAYQLGVDTFTFRAEKRFTGGSVVMEVWFDRTKPDDDRFEVTVIDPIGKTVRTERFTRKEIEATHDILLAVHPDNSPLKNCESPERRAQHRARWERIRDLFPKPKEGAAPVAAAPQARN